MKISLSCLESNGRLGNQLFQITSTMGLAEKYGASAAFPEWSYQKYFETQLPHGDMQTETVKELNFHHYDWKLSGDCDLLGYMQSEKYFGSFRLKFDDQFVDKIKKTSADLFDRETICIHIRRGDYVGNKAYYQLPVTYYIDSLLTYFPNWKDYNILFISDDIEYCRTHFECMTNAYFSDGNSDIYDLALASCCDHFILSNSSFGWWAAWLGEKKHSTIIHPGHMYAGRLAKNDTRDYWPERWTRNQKDEYKIDLKDVTFTIPVSYDHADRKENFDLSLYMLQSSFDTNYITCEQGGWEFEYCSKWARYIREDSKDFHRTKMLNDMCKLSDTPYIVNWDCDVIIPPMQLFIAVGKLREGADMVFPYDGKFARMRRNEWMEKIRISKDIGIVGNEKFKGREDDHYSVGGAVMFNRDSFIAGGMENENIISFGPEDCERDRRFRVLGYDVQRTGGALFHMNHFVGDNSSPRNPYFDKNSMEYEKIKAMDKNELRAYVDTWAWRNQYTSVYYDEISEGAIRSAEVVMDELHKIGLIPETVIDVGCGIGEWRNGNPGYIGVDYLVPRSKLLIPQHMYRECDLNGDVINVEGGFDLCLCLEVAEHLKPSRAPELINMLCGLSDRVLFSAAIPYQGGQGHVNEQWASYWAGLFRDNGFGAASRQPDIRNNAGVELWYRQNIILYIRGGTGTVQDFVLPEYYEQIVVNLHSRLEEKNDK